MPVTDRGAALSRMHRLLVTEHDMSMMAETGVSAIWRRAKIKTAIRALEQFVQV
jgi:hypothetical protein